MVRRPCEGGSVDPRTVTIGQHGIERILAGHPWIYRTDLAASPTVEGGAVVRVIDRKKRYWGQALYSSKSQSALRLLTRESRPFDRAFLAERIAAAEAYRKQVVEGAAAYRLVSGEGDQLPS